MPYSTRRIQHLVRRHAGRELDALELRCRAAVASYFQAKEEYAQSQQQYIRCQQEYLRLQGVVQAKQEVIEVLLPHYPHPLTPELRAKIALT